MNLKSREEAFRFVMCEAWNEIQHINDSLNPLLSIHIYKDKFTLELVWSTDFGSGHHESRPLTLTGLCEANFSMTGWLRTFIHESKIQESCPVRQAYKEAHRDASHQNQGEH